VCTLLAAYTARVVGVVPTTAYAHFPSGRSHDDPAQAWSSCRSGRPSLAVHRARRAALGLTVRLPSQVLARQPHPTTVTGILAG